MSTVYESLMESLTEEVEDIKKYGKSQGRRTVLEVKPVREYSAREIKAIRALTGTSQAVFAKCFGVSKKTVEAWEEGINTPSGPASRILELVSQGDISMERYLVKK
ncbi:MAG: transcriptional regulator [Lachnospiraceae bacterium]|nr:transcriptional regulator [Lachnospiraceae bacterium]